MRAHLQYLLQRDHAYSYYCFHSTPLVYKKKKEMLQSAAVSRLTLTADRITKSKYENHCCSQEPSAKPTGPGSGLESLFRVEVDSNIE